MADDSAKPPLTAPRADVPGRPSPDVGAYYGRRALASRDVWTAAGLGLGIGAGVGLVGFYLARIWLQREPLGLPDADAGRS